MLDNAEPAVNPPVNVCNVILTHFCILLYMHASANVPANHLVRTTTSGMLEESQQDFLRAIKNFLEKRAYQLRGVVLRTISWTGC